MKCCDISYLNYVFGKYGESMRMLTPFFLLMFLIVACSDNTTNNDQSLITGRWEGEITFQVDQIPVKLGLKLNLSEKDGNVSGNGTYYVSNLNFPQEFNVIVSGSFKNPTLNITFSGVTGLSYKGDISVTNNKMIIGTLNTMEYSAQTLTLNKVN